MLGLDKAAPGQIGFYQYLICSLLRRSGPNHGPGPQILAQIDAISGQVCYDGIRALLNDESVVLMGQPPNGEDEQAREKDNRKESGSRRG